MLPDVSRKQALRAYITRYIVETPSNKWVDVRAILKDDMGEGDDKTTVHSLPVSRRKAFRMMLRSLLLEKNAISLAVFRHAQTAMFFYCTVMLNTPGAREHGSWSLRLLSMRDD